MREVLYVSQYICAREVTPGAPDFYIMKITGAMMSLEGLRCRVGTIWKGAYSDTDVPVC